ncbi:MAG: sensor histidine kinase [Chroococcidiopsidaceae cyanobacterium CP_BM_ER_R8_30]|nr:sensor histidine kinase [Chroococcidiopsidaceae cyanobacterium CP_BM_ER_R8_30]
MDFSRLLLSKIDTIIETWVAAVRQDRQIETVTHLPFNSVRNSLPRLLQSMATTLSSAQDNDIQTLVETSLTHGLLRAEQGFKAAEIAREYRILRQVIFSVLEPTLLQNSVKDVVRAMRLIDTVIDEAIAWCFKSYTEQRWRELNQLQHQLMLNNQELKRLVRENQDNLSHLAHELKSPLTSIIGYSDLFLRQQKLHPREGNTVAKMEHIEHVLHSGRQLLRLINDALEISRCEAGQMQLQLMPVDVCALVRSVVEMLEPLAYEKELQIDVDCDQALAQVLTDSLRLQQIVTNLISNAIRYTETGSIQVRCRLQADKHWTIAISDTGVGIEPEDQAHIFEPYYRVGFKNQPNLPDSTGLGLAIVARLVQLLQGEIELVSQVGVGSTFTVIFPFTLNHALGE